MIPYQKEKIENAICFFALEHYTETGCYLYQTFLYKYLAFLDFNTLEKIGRPSLGLTYRALEQGPVPCEIYDKRKHYTTELFEFELVDREKNAYVIIPKKEPNLDYFSDCEIEIMDTLIEEYAHAYVSSDESIEASHQRILAWKRTWQHKKNDFIKYIDNFPEDILNKPEAELSLPEQHFVHFLTLEKLENPAL